MTINLYQSKWHFRPIKEISLKSLCPRLYCHPGITTTSVKHICPPYTSKALASSDNSRKILLNSISAFHNSIWMFLLHLITFILFWTFLPVEIDKIQSLQFNYRRFLKGITFFPLVPTEVRAFSVSSKPKCNRVAEKKYGREKRTHVHHFESIDSTLKEIWSPWNIEYTCGFLFLKFTKRFVGLCLSWKCNLLP